MHRIGLVEGAAVDTDAEVGPGGKGEARAGPEQQQPHGAGRKRRKAETDCKRQQKLFCRGESEKKHGRLGRRKMEDTLGCGEHCKKRKYGPDADDFRKRGDDHEQEQEPELSMAARTDVMPETKE